MQQYIVLDLFIILFVYPHYHSSFSLQVEFSYNLASTWKWG